MSKLVSDTVDKLSKDILKQQDVYILSQLNELVSRGLIVVETTNPIITRENNFITGDFDIKISQGIRLVPKEFQYIKKLEEENKDLKSKLNIIRKTVEYIYE